MKDKIIGYIGIFMFFLIIFLMMLADDGVFGEKIDNILGWIVLIGSIVFVLLCVIANIYNKFKK